MGLSSPSDGSMSQTYHRGRERALVAASGVAALLAAVWLVVRWRPFRLEIQGDSMAPTLLPGDRALAAAPGKLARGRVVVVEHPERPSLEMVKRIRGMPGDLAPDGRILGPDEYWVEGDNPPRSTDSRQLGPVGREHIKALVRLVYWPPGRRAIVRSRTAR